MWQAPLPWASISSPFLPPGENWVGIVLINYTVRVQCLYQRRQGWTSVPRSWKERCWGLWPLWSPELVPQQRTIPRESSGFGLHWAYPSVHAEGGKYVNAQSSVTLQSYGKSICTPHQNHSMSQGCPKCNLAPHGEPLQKTEGWSDILGRIQL